MTRHLKTASWLRKSWSAFVASLFLSPIAAIADDDIEHDFLFLLEEAYTQEKDEWQIGLSYSQLSIDDSDQVDQEQTIELGIEYGLTNHFQVELTLPYKFVDFYSNADDSDASGFGNAEFELGYKVLEEQSWWPTISVGGGIEIAASDKDGIREDSNSFEAFINASKYIDDVGFIHLTLTYEESEEDEVEQGYGIGIGRPLNDAWIVNIEYLHTNEQEAGEASETLNQLLLGTSYTHSSGAIFGVGYALGDNDEMASDLLTAKFQIEF